MTRSHLHEVPTPAQTSTPDPEAEPARDLWQERVAIIGRIDAALEALPSGSSTAIEHIGTRDGKSLGVVVAYDRSHGGRNSRTDLHGLDELNIQGTVHGSEETEQTTFPMYRIRHTIPNTDSGWLEPHYEISAADPEGQDGYKPVALVMQSILHTKEGPTFSGSPKIGGYADLFTDSIEQLSPTELAELQETGLYVNPEAQAKFTEVQTIMELVVAQSQVSPDQPTLPLDFTVAA
jgi:hypothetical protein